MISNWIQLLFNQIIFIFENIFLFFSISPIHFLLFVYIIFTIILNIVRLILIEYERKHLPLDYACRYLKNNTCYNLRYVKAFKQRNCSCDNCCGRDIGIDDTQIEHSACQSSKLKKFLILLANITASITPYIIFVNTIFTGVLTLRT